jgi:predicted RNA methylase
VPSDADHPAFAIGREYESTLSEHARRQGAHFTPPAVALTLTDCALTRWGTGAPVVCDPTCGGGAFLVAAAQVLHDRGIDAERIVNELVRGIDLDPGAVYAANAALEMWAHSHGVNDPRPQVRVGDVFDSHPGLDGEVDVVVGNPPFQSQLQNSTVRASDDRDRLIAMFGEIAAGYVDTSTLMVVKAVQMVRTGGVVAMILPCSVLSAASARPARVWLGEVARPQAVWSPQQRVFDAAVDVCAPLLHLGSFDSKVEVLDDAARVVDTVPWSSMGESWAPVLATAMGVPFVDGGGERLGAFVTATAGFRDEYYGLVASAVDSERGDDLKLMTTGLIDPLQSRWGQASATIGGRSFNFARSDASSIDASSRLGRWCERLRHPKTLVAPQSRVIEAVADLHGEYLPLTPVVAVLSDTLSPAHVTAALSAPAASAWLAHRCAGTGMSAQSLRLSAKQLQEIPTPTDTTAWEEAATMIGAGVTKVVALEPLLSRLWGPPDEAVTAWWRSRLPHRRRALQ